MKSSGFQQKVRGPGKPVSCALLSALYFPTPRLPESEFQDFAWPRALTLLDHLASSVIQKVDPEGRDKGENAPCRQGARGGRQRAHRVQRERPILIRLPHLAVTPLWLDCPRPPLCGLIDRPGNTRCRATGVRGILSYFRP